MMELGCHGNASPVVVLLLWLIPQHYFYFKTCLKFLETLLQGHGDRQFWMLDEGAGTRLVFLPGHCLQDGILESLCWRERLKKLDVLV